MKSTDDKLVVSNGKHTIVLDGDKVYLDGVDVHTGRTPLIDSVLLNVTFTGFGALVGFILCQANVF